MTRRLTIAALLCIFAAPRTLPAAPNESDIRPVGVASVDITPDYAIRLSGYGNRRLESEGVELRIWAKALAFGSDAEGPGVLLTVDNCGIPDAMRAEVLSRLDNVLRLVRTSKELETTRVAMASTVTTPSSPPAAPRRWPVIDFVDETTSPFLACSPNTRLMAWHSATSPCGVEVPWVFTYPTLSGATPASFRAMRIARWPPSPSGAGAVMWFASALAPYPASSA